MLFPYGFKERNVLKVDGERALTLKRKKFLHEDLDLTREIVSCEESEERVDDFL